MKTAHKETHRSQESIICKLPGQPLLFNVLGCSVKDKRARRHRSAQCQSFCIAFSIGKIHKLPPLQVGPSKHVTTVWV